MWWCDVRVRVCAKIKCAFERACVRAPHPFGAYITRTRAHTRATYTNIHMYSTHTASIAHPFWSIRIQKSSRTRNTHTHTHKNMPSPLRYILSNAINRFLCVCVRCRDSEEKWLYIMPCQKIQATFQKCRILHIHILKRQIHFVSFSVWMWMCYMLCVMCAVES